MINVRAEAQQPEFGYFTQGRIQLLGAVGLAIPCYGLAVLLLMWGSFKCFTFEAKALQAPEQQRTHR